jgi:hypothetical protein
MIQPANDGRSPRESWRSQYKKELVVREAREIGS